MAKIDRDQDLVTMFGLKLRKLRKAAGLDQDELGKLVGSSRSSISFYEMGKRVPTVDVLAGICRALGVTPNQMLGFTDAETIEAGGQIVKNVVKNTEFHLCCPKCGGEDIKLVEYDFSFMTMWPYGGLLGNMYNVECQECSFKAMDGYGRSTPEGAIAAWYEELKKYDQ